MAKIKLDYGSVQNSCITSLDNIINSLNEAISYLQQDYIPSDFYRKTTLSNTIADIKSQRDILSNVRTWLINSNKNYDSLIDKLNLQAYKMPVYQVKKRKSII